MKEIPIEIRAKIMSDERKNICLNYCDICNRKECTPKRCGKATVKWMESE